ncbi:MAG: hypothetical protein ABEI75_01400 [Halobaculum sp.]
MSADDSRARLEWLKLLLEIVSLTLAILLAVLELIRRLRLLRSAPRNT